MRHQLLRLLNVKPHETRLVQQLFLVQFFLVIGASFLFVTANAVFLPVYTAAELPRAFLISGICLLVANRIYGFLEHRLGVKKQLIIMIVAIAVVTFIIWAGLQFSRNNIIVYALFVWNNVVYLLSNLLFWGLASLLFDVRESRRIFTIIGAGDIPARLLGYLSVSVVAPYIGLHNMIWISVIAFLISILFLRQFFKESPLHVLHPHRHEEHSQAVSFFHMLKKFFGSDLIISISFLSLATFAALLLIDFSFLSEAQIKFHTDVELASFLGIFFALGTCLGIIIKITVSSRLIDRLGMVWSLLLSPVILLITVLVILVVTRSAYFSGQFLYLLGFMAMLTEILKATIQEPVFLVLFQPLKPALRLRGHYIAKGYMMPLSFLLVGGILLSYMHRQVLFNISFFSFFLLILLAVWIFSVFIVKKNYLETLHHTLKSGLFRGNELLLKDKTIEKLLVEKTGSLNTTEALYALDLLEKSGYENMDDLLRDQLSKPDKQLIFYTLDKFASRRQVSAIHDIELLLQHHNNAEVKAKCLQVLGMIHPDFVEKFMHYLHSENELCRQAAISGLLISDDLNGLLIAGKELLELMQSADPADRLQAAEIIGTTRKNNFYKTLKTLLDDPDPAVQKEAIRAAGKIRHESLLPLLVRLLQQPVLHKEVQLALMAYGDMAFDHFRKILAAEKDIPVPLIISVAARINGEASMQFLLHCQQQYPAFEQLIVNYLWEKSFEAAKEEKPRWQLSVHHCMQEAATMLHMKESFQQASPATELVKALEEEINEKVKHLLKLFSFIYDRSKINQVIEVVGLKDKKKWSNAVEMMEMIIPREEFSKFRHITERNIFETAHHKHNISSQKITDHIRNIIESSSIAFNDWTRAMAMVIIRQKEFADLVPFLRTFPEQDLSFILRETKAFVISGK